MRASRRGLAARDLTRSVVLYGLLVLHGRDLIAVTVAVTGPFALAFGPVAMGPELCACIIAATYPESLLRR